MKRIVISATVIASIILIAIYLNMPHKGYDELYDAGQWHALKDGEREGWYLRIGDSIYGSDVNEIKCCVKYNDPLEIDINTFLVSAHCDYAKDKKHVYFPITVICEEWLDVDSDGCDNSCYFKEYIVHGADPETFKYIGRDYGADKHNMYLRGEKIPWENDSDVIYDLTTVFLDHEFDGNVDVYDSTGLVIKTLKNNLEVKNFIMFKLLGKNDSMYHVKAYNSNFYGYITEGLIYKNNNLEIFAKSYPNGFILYKTPFNRDSIAVRHEHNPERLEVLDMKGKWLKVRTNIDGKIFIGWLPPEMQCSDLYSPCK